MLRRLRLKFVALNMATVAVVLAVVFTAICVINYQQGTTACIPPLMPLSTTQATQPRCHPSTASSGRKARQAAARFRE